MMKAKWTSVLAGITVLTIIFSTGYQPVVAAPTGELTIVSSLIGNEIPIPWEERLTANDYLKLLYDPLVGTTPDGKVSTKAGLAEKWEMSPDGLTWTFYLRKGVKFHDGVELTAKDVKFTIEKNMGPDSTLAFAPIFRNTVKNTEVKDNYTLLIHCKNPYPFMPESLFSDIGTVSGLIAPKDYYERVGRDKFFAKPMGSGPYKFHSQYVGSYIKLEATDKHWRDGVPRYKYVTFRIIPEESTRVAMLKTGEADIARISRGSAKECLDAGLNLISKENAATVNYWFTSQYASPTLSDLRFRKALNLALDKEAIIKNIFGGMAKLTTTYPGANILGLRSAPALKPYPYDPQEAKRLIKEGGWEGVELTVLNIPRAGCPEIGRLTEAVYGYWEKIGLKPKMRNMEWAIFRTLRKEGKAVGWLAPTDATTGTDLSLLLTLFAENLQSKGDWGVMDPKVEAMIVRAQRSLDRAEVEKIVVDLYRYVYDNYILIPICDMDDMTAASKKVPKWDPGLRRNERNFIDVIKEQ